VGSQLSIQGWLAITGLEFSLIGTIVLPRIASITVSKVFTRRLSSTGMPLSSILNSMSSAPLETQIRSGLKRVFLLRALVLALASALGVLYKFSFVRVAANDTVPIFTTSGNPYSYDYTPIGDSDIPVTDDPITRTLSTQILSSNFQDLLAANNDSTRFFGTSLNFWDSSITTSRTVDLVLGPKINQTKVAQILNGTVQSCDALLYTRHAITTISAIQDWGIDPWPSTQIPNSVRISAVLWNATINGIQGGFMDVTNIANGSLQAYSGSLFPAFKDGSLYSDAFNVTTQYCYGYNTWSNTASVDQRFSIEDPQDIQCVVQSFNVNTWNASQNGFIAQGFIQAVMAAQSTYYNSFWYSGLGIILAIRDRPAPFAKSLPRNPLCSSFESQGNVFAVASGVINSHRTGMTMLGLVLQGLAIGVAIWALGTILVPVLPLIGEWPAQWLGIVGGLDREEIEAMVEGASTGQNAVREAWTVYLSSGESPDFGRAPGLRLARTKGVLRDVERHM
jgi:hypothetical protein